MFSKIIDNRTAACNRADIFNQFTHSVNVPCSISTAVACSGGMYIRSIYDSMGHYEIFCVTASQSKYYRNNTFGEWNVEHLDKRNAGLATRPRHFVGIVYGGRTRTFVL